ncbi:MAG: serine protease [Candidatus Caenarcaniphilales bacterium]|nr:serine protease [Candidatus Caenarcaniphilales bacterium]
MLLVLTFLVGSSNFVLKASAVVSPKNIYSNYSDSVLMISNESSKGDDLVLNFGTAFSINDSGLLLTSAHLIRKNSSVTDSYGNKLTILAVEWIDEEADLAVIKVNKKVQALPLATSYNTQIGETLTIISNPSGFQNTLTQGVLSSKRNRDNMQVLQYSAPISPGSSGGPIFNEDGQVIGVVQGIYTAANSQNLNFGIPVELLPSKFLQPAIQSKQLASKQSSGSEQMAKVSFYLNQSESTAEDSNYQLLKLLSQMIDQEPEDPFAYLMRGMVKQKMNDYFGALNDLKHGQKMLEKDVQIFSFSQSSGRSKAIQLF